MVNVALVLLAACASVASAVSVPALSQIPAVVAPTVSVARSLALPAAFPNPFGTGMSYKMGNLVLTGQVNIYNIYYGNWADKQVSIVDDFTSGIAGSSWWNIMKKYYYQKDAASPKVYVGDNVKLAKSVFDNYSKGKALSNTDIPDIIQAKIDAGELPIDSNAIYMFLVSGDVKESIRADLGKASFCVEYCGYHVSWQLKTGERIYYSFVGIPAGACINGCVAPYNRAASPNKDVGVDGMLSALAHEIVEAVSDPVSDSNTGRAWEDGRHQENGDKCAFKFGTTAVDETTKAQYNIEFGSRRYLIQQNWDLTTNACAQSA